ncbi:winged helix-turn-helix domain-containing protein [Aliikangiella coralliicola]|uniref:OmpR/PhoB-type domain-containing protein n=1 Tax=Aliikangiella coralliicola TaxID=2592383 RepID=A0A545U6C4_9GAMM|nr:winged helix-turn-helix domain-containing protein [Aliikangiella coralliicola]TQV85025.1 hypothetical protein FLL46_21790 [Aliikangiella coralliicola]
MEAAKPNSCQHYRIGKFEVNFSERSITSPDGNTSHLTNKHVELLKILIDNRETYLKSSEILNLLYGEQYVEVAVIRQHIKNIRGLFHVGIHETEQAEYINSKRGGGYRLVAEVEEIFVKKTVGNNLSINLMAVLLFTVITTVAILSFYTEPTDQKLVNDSFKKFVPLTFLKGIEFYPSPSPDGNWMIFGHKPPQSGFWLLFVKDFNTGQITQLTRGEFVDTNVSWNKDSDKILFTRIKKGQCYFMQADFHPKTQSLSDINAVHRCPHDAQSSYAVFWPDEQGIFYSTTESFSEPYNLYSFAFENQQGWQVTASPPKGRGDYYLALSNSGEKLAVLRSKNWFDTEIRVLNTKTWESQLIDQVEEPLFSVSWSADDQNLYYKNASNEVVKTHIETLETQIISRASVPIYYPKLVNSDPPSIIAVHGGFSTNDIISHDLMTGEQTTLIESDYNDYMPSISPDGQLLTWISNRSGRYQVWLKNSKGQIKQLTNLPKNRRFTSLDINADATKIGGTVHGEWFVYDIYENQIKWSDDANGKFNNFKWTSDPNKAYLAKESGERWSQVILDVETAATNSTLNTDTYLAVDSIDGNSTYHMSLSGKAMTIEDNMSSNQKTIQLIDKIIYSYQWDTTQLGLFYSQKGELGWELHLLPANNNKVPFSPIPIPSGSVTISKEVKQLITSKNLEGKTEIVILQ